MATANLASPSSTAPAPPVLPAALSRTSSAAAVDGSNAPASFPSPVVDDAVIETVFHATVPLAFHVLDASGNMTASPPLYVLAPRQSYLHAVLARVPHAVAGLLPRPPTPPGDATGPPASSAADLQRRLASTSFLCDATGTTLPWHVPIGVLYDQYQHPALHTHDDASWWSPTNGIPPWRVRVARTTDAPAATAFPFTGLAQLESLYMHAVKEAEYMAFGSARKVMALSKSFSEQLWRGVMDNNLSQVEAVAKDLFHNEPVARAWPVRVHVREPADIVTAFQPLLTPSAAPEIGHIVAAAGVEDSDSHVILVQGIALTRDTPMAWVHRHLVGCDGWVHIVVIKQGGGEEVHDEALVERTTMD
ncbi:autophagy protein 5 [Allomyces arbusculus]|nr:autophagy protein 5 [Allomyces arbusculus]